MRVVGGRIARQGTGGKNLESFTRTREGRKSAVSIDRVSNLLAAMLPEFDMVSILVLRGWPEIDPDRPPFFEHRLHHPPINVLFDLRRRVHSYDITSVVVVQLDRSITPVL
jgi:hypothetical protein